MSVIRQYQELSEKLNSENPFTVGSSDVYARDVSTVYFNEDGSVYDNVQMEDTPKTSVYGESLILIHNCKHTDLSIATSKFFIPDDFMDMRISMVANDFNTSKETIRQLYAVGNYNCQIFGEVIMPVNDDIRDLADKNNVSLVVGDESIKSRLLANLIAFSSELPISLSEDDFNTLYEGSLMEINKRHSFDEMDEAIEMVAFINDIDLDGVAHDMSQ